MEIGYINDVDVNSLSHIRIGGYSHKDIDKLM